MKNTSFNSLLAAALLVFQLPAMAEDIDLFMGNPPSTPEPANVLLIYDNTANWNTPFAIEKAALATVFNGLPENKYRIGLMLFTETGNPNNNVDGGYVRAAVRLMDATNKAKYANLINGFDVLADKSNGGKLGKTMQEAYKYFAGLAPVSGNNKVKTDYTGNVTAGAYLTNSRAVWALPGNALPSFNGSPYNPPPSTGCPKNYIIYISNGPVQDNNSPADTPSPPVAISPTTIPLSPNQSQSNVADEWARFMKADPLNITTFTIDIAKTTSTTGQGFTALLKSMAKVSGGEYYDIAPEGLELALNDALGKIQAVNTVFASVSLPASVGTQGTYLNQIYIGMFRPDTNANPRWPGNLKQYKLGFDSTDTNQTSLKLVYDVADGDTNNLNDKSAILPLTGFIDPCARSFWTPTTTDTYWTTNATDPNWLSTNSPPGPVVCSTVANSKVANYPDGPIVEKGAQGYKLRGITPSTRTVYTCSPAFASCTGLTNFSAGSSGTPANNAAITQALLDPTNTVPRATLIDWQRGQDLKGGGEEGVSGSAEMRQSVHGDVIHSRPVAINHGTDASPQVVVYYSANDGMLRAINGNRTGNVAGFTPGSELWSFVAPEFYDKIKRIYDNSTAITFPSGIPGANAKPYGIDGPITAYQNGSTAYVYAGMRRGGRALYAFNVSNPASPSLKWKIGCPNLGNDTGCTGAPGFTGNDFTGIGQTWSPATPFKASGYNTGGGSPVAKPMLIMGGGYDTCEDYDGGTGGANHQCTSTKGNRIYVLDADTGQLLKTMNTDRAVVGGITLVLNNAGFAQWGYAADLGGNVYRISGVDAHTEIGTTAPGLWTITKIASLGCNTAAACTANRKFLFAPDVVREPGIQDTFYLTVGSGDREKPLLSYSAAASVDNYFFMLKDIPASTSWPSSPKCDSAIIHLDIPDLTNSCLTPITTAADPSETALEAKKGWYLDLASAEQVVTSSITVSNVVTFSTHQPTTPSACSSNLGEARVYNILYTNARRAGYPDGTARFQDIQGDGLPPSPVAGQVTLDNGTTVPFLIGGSPDSPLEGGSPSGTFMLNQPRSRVYWYIQQ